jgi:hypothetical protein
VSATPVFKVKATSCVLCVYEDSLTIERSGLSSAIIHGLHGTKRIPFRSIRAVQMKEGGWIAGYLQLTIDGGVESVGGAYAAAGDENSVLFESKHNALMKQIREYIEERMGPVAAAPPPAAASLADELGKLAGLLAQGLISREEFDQAKAKLLR